MRTGRRDVLEVRRLAANQAAEADDRRKFSARCGLLGGKRNFKGTWHLDDADVVCGDPRRLERVEGTRLQTFCDEVVEFRHHEGEFQARGLLRTFEGEHAL
jgi:hypothetical protein